MKFSTHSYSLLKKSVLHIAAWAGVLSIVFLLFYSNSNDDPYPDADWRMRLHFVITVLSLAAFFYLYSYILIPRLLYRKKKVLFILASAILVTGFVEGMNVYFRYMQSPMPAAAGRHAPHLPPGYPPPPGKMDSLFPLQSPGYGPPGPGNNIAGTPKQPLLPYTVTLLPFLLMVTASIAYRYITDGIKTENQLKEEKMAAISSELQFLKSQISPHFLFNVLNNLTFLARKNSALLEPSLIKLSSLLRYMLYDSNQEHVLLDSEIKYLEDYIGLQEIRHQELKVITYFSNDQENLTIAPMLLIPFVENAFKHANGFVDDSSFIKIELITKDNRLYFKISNKYTDTEIEQKDNASGIGLANVQKRLQLLYPERHNLSIQKNSGIFSVSLQVNLM